MKVKKGRKKNLTPAYEFIVVSRSKHPSYADERNYRENQQKLAL